MASRFLRVGGIAAAVFALVMFSAVAAERSSPIRIVAAENFYGDIAQQIGGLHVTVTSILNSPAQDPHMFEASVGTAKALAAADLVVYNGLDYDPWMEKLLGVSGAGRTSGRIVLVAADLLHKKAGDNPHLWYDPLAMPVVARSIAASLEAADPAHRAAYEMNLQAVLAALGSIGDKVRLMRSRYAGTPATATEPVFGYMAQALGLEMRNERFQLAVMNGTEPAASAVAALENDLKNRKVKILFYNAQASGGAAGRMQKIAHDAGVNVVGISETEPAGKHFQAWMMDQLEATEQALGGAAK